MIWLTQWLCSRRHAAFAIPWSDAETTAEAVEAEGERLRVEHGINTRCGICGGPIAPEAGRTRFRTMAEALPALRQAEADNLASRREMDRLGLTRERFVPPEPA